jgi:hypothetical protein
MSRHGIAFGLTAERLTKSVIHLGSAIGSEPAMEALSVEKLRGASLLKHYSGGNDFRAPWRVAHPLPELLLPIVCGTIAAGSGILTV